MDSRIALLAGVLTLALSSCSQVWAPEEKAIIDGEGVMKVYTIDSQSDSVLLRTPSVDITKAELRSRLYPVLADRMVQTVTSPEQDGVGIAGPQVGLLRRIVAVQRLDKPGEPFEVYPNIRIVAKRGDLELGAEGCLSVPGRRGKVRRYRDIDIQYTSPKSLNDTLETVLGFTAVIFQHECDHLDGVLYIDKVE